jgi:hypothetical protein
MENKDINSRASRHFKFPLLIMWGLMIFTVLSTFFCYWLIDDPWAMYERVPFGSLTGGIYWALTTLGTIGLVPIVWTFVLLLDHKISPREDPITDSLEKKGQPTPGQTPFYKDKFRVIMLISLIFISLPWILALFGVFIDDIPGLRFFMSKEAIPWEDNLPAVHLGMHHGYTGFYLCIFVFLVSYSINAIKTQKLRTFWGLTCNIVLFFGIYSVAQDFMNEQFYNFFRLNGTNLPFLNLIPFDFGDYRMIIVLLIIIILGVVCYLYIWRKHIEFDSN